MKKVDELNLVVCAFPHSKPILYMLIVLKPKRSMIDLFRSIQNLGRICLFPPLPLKMKTVLFCITLQSRILELKWRVLQIRMRTRKEKKEEQ